MIISDEENSSQKGYAYPNGTVSTFQYSQSYTLLLSSKLDTYMYISMRCAINFLFKFFLCTVVYPKIAQLNAVPMATVTEMNSVYVT